MQAEGSFMDAVATAAPGTHHVGSCSGNSQLARQKGPPRRGLEHSTGIFEWLLKGENVQVSGF